MTKHRNPKHHQQNPQSSLSPGLTQKGCQQSPPDQPDIKPELHSDAAPKEQTWKDITLHNKIMIVLTVVGIVVASIGGIIYYFQLRTAHDSLTLLQKQFKESQRPYIAITGFTVHHLNVTASTEPDLGAPVSASVHYKNIGKSAAFKFTIHRHMLFASAADNFRADDLPGASGNDVIDPGTEGFTTAASLRDTYAPESLMIDPNDLVNWNGQAILVFGAIYYMDSGGTLYCTPYSQMYNPLGKNWIAAADFSTDNKSHQHTENELCPKGER